MESRSGVKSWRQRKTRIYGWTLTNFKKNGLLGMVRTKPGPRRAHKLSEPVVKFIEEQKAQDPMVTLDELVKRIKKQFALQVHIRSIQRALKRKKKKSP